MVGRASKKCLCTNPVMVTSLFSCMPHVHTFISHPHRRSLARSLPPTFLQGVTLMLFCLGDRAYGPQFCAAGRKLAVRWLQLGATLLGQTNNASIGYGDDATPGGGCLADLEEWIASQLQPQLQILDLWRDNHDNEDDRDHVLSSVATPVVPYRITPLVKEETDGSEDDRHVYLDTFFRYQAPLTAYVYEANGTTLRRRRTGNRAADNLDNPHHVPPLTATVVQNDRLTSLYWEQDTRHMRLEIQGIPPSPDHLSYVAGDVLAVLPVNHHTVVDRFLAVLPQALQLQADMHMGMETLELHASALLLGVAYTHWPQQFTLRDWLTYCADIAALPEREDLWALSHACDVQQHDTGVDQRAKLRALSETAASALYTDYVLREKRTWADVLFDFDSLRSTGSALTLETLLALLSPLRPREFSIASAPTTEARRGTFGIELTVAVVQGKTPRGRAYEGLCSSYIARIAVGEMLRVWIRPGSFAALPVGSHAAATPVLYIGAGTGIAPLRGLIRERRAHAKEGNHPAPYTPPAGTIGWSTSDILLFGCRRATSDFYYEGEWDLLREEGELTLLTAFSQDQTHKVYVQQTLKQEDPGGDKLLDLLLTRQGHLYIAGGARMARSAKEEIAELLAPHLGGETLATQFLSRLQRLGRFRVEAWS